MNTVKIGTTGRKPTAWVNTGRVSGLYYGGFPTWGAGMGNSVVTLNKLYATEYMVGDTCTFDQIAVACLGVASSTTRLGAYEDAGGRPGALIGDYGTVDCATLGFKTIDISLTKKGKIWLVAVGQGTAPQLRCINSFGNPNIGITSGYSTDQSPGISQASITGALPANWGSSTTSEAYGTVPMLYLRAK